jgi:hypothetical protein
MNNRSAIIGAMSHGGASDPTDLLELRLAGQVAETMQTGVPFLCEGRFPAQGFSCDCQSGGTLPLGPGTP